MMHMSQNHPDVILANVQRGQFPSNWHVIKGNLTFKRALKESFSSGLLTAFLVLLFLFFTYLMWVVFGSLVRSLVELLVLTPIFGFVYCLSLAAYTMAARDTLLILAPDCFMHYCYVSTLTNYVFTSHSYSDIANIDIRHSSDPFRATLDIQYYDGRHFLWRCDNAFAPALQTARDIIAAHARYTALNTNIYQPESAYMQPHQ